MNTLEVIAVASFGAGCQELMYWYELRRRLEEISSLAKSPSYWVITTLMICASGVGTWILYSTKLPERSLYFILGAAFPLLLKQAVRSISSETRTLGKTNVRRYFLLEG